MGKTNCENPQFNNNYRQPSGYQWHNANEWIGATNRVGIVVTPYVWMVGNVAFKNIGSRGHVLFVEKINRNPNNSSEIYSIVVSDYNKTGSHELNRYTLVPGTSSYPDKFIHVTYTQIECTDTGLCDDITKNISVPGGARGETSPTDEKDPGKPDFIVKRLELSKYNPAKSDRIKIRAKLKNIGSDDISSDKKIETRFYLSMKLKFDGVIFAC